MAKFDKHRPHGVVYGHTAIAFEQDGKQFRPDGTLYEEAKNQADLLAGSADRNILHLPPKSP